MCHWCVVELKLWSNYNYSYIAEGTHRLPCKRHTNQTKSQRKKNRRRRPQRRLRRREKKVSLPRRCVYYMSIFISSSRHSVRTFFYSTFFHIFLLCTCVTISFNTISIVLYHQCTTNTIAKIRNTYFSSLCLSRAHKHAYNWTLQQQWVHGFNLYVVEFERFCKISFSYSANFTPIGICSRLAVVIYLYTWLQKKL